VTEPAAQPKAAGASVSPKPAKAEKADRAGKVEKAAKPVKVPKAPKAEKAEKATDTLVRDSFTMPQADFALIAELKTRAATAGRPAKKSELLRAGLRLLAAQSPKALAAALGRLEPVKLGRPRQQG
jgi:plasmid stability protein